MKHAAMLYGLLAAAAAGLALAAEPAQKDLGLFYRDNCVRCHGADGAARGANGKGLRGQDFTAARWRERTSDAEMVKIILKGKFFGLVMPGYAKQLSGEDAQRLVTEILRKAVKGAAIGPEQPRQP